MRNAGQAWCRESFIALEYSFLSLKRASAVVNCQSALGTREAFYAWDLPEDVSHGLEGGEPAVFKAQFDHELEV